MRAKITSIADRGDAAKERIVIKVQADLDIGSFAVFRSLVQEGLITTGITDTFWFPNKTVGAGDLVVLYSKRGTDSERAQNSGSKAHFYYWGKAAPLWGAKNHAPVLVHTPEWNEFTD